MILALVQAGLGVSLIPRLALESQDVSLTVAPVTDPPLYRRVLLAACAGSSARPAVATLTAALERVAAQMPDAEHTRDSEPR